MGREVKKVPVEILSHYPIAEGNPPLGSWRNKVR
jgi:hypothetical protein